MGWQELHDRNLGVLSSTVCWKFNIKRNTPPPKKYKLKGNPHQRGASVLEVRLCPDLALCRLLGSRLTPQNHNGLPQQRGRTNTVTINMIEKSHMKICL